MLYPDFSTIPAELRERPNWVLWKVASRRDGDKPTKLPFQPSGSLAMADDASTWFPYEKVLSRFSQGKYDGIGFEFPADRTMCGVDLDGCRDPVTEVITDWAREIIEAFDTYTEVSPSGTGVKMFLFGKWPLLRGKKLELPMPKVCDKNPAIEVYDHGRYFAVTGLKLDGPASPMPRQDVLDWLCDKFFRNGSKNGNVNGHEHNGHESTSDIERCKRYISKTPDAISGQAGHDKTLRAACECFRFGLSAEDARGIMRWFNESKTGDEPWTTEELSHKLADAKMLVDSAGEFGCRLTESSGKVTAKEYATPKSAPKPKSATPWRPFPIDAMPQPLRRFCIETARAQSCDVSFVALPSLAACAACIGNTHKIRLKRQWDEPSIIWAAVVGESGSGKSPAQAAATSPLWRRQSRAFETFQKAQQEYEIAKAAFDAENGKRRKGTPAAEEIKLPPEPPVCQRMLVSDVTIEALAPILRDNWRGLLLERDELAAWLGGFNEYKKGVGGDTAKWLTIHGARDLLIDRRTGDRRTIHVPRANVSIVGGVQPEILRQALGRERFQDGLAARLLLAMPPSAKRGWTEDEIPEDAELDLIDLYDRLLLLEPAMDEDGKPVPRILSLTASGKSAWVEFDNAHLSVQADLTGDLASAWSKLEAYTARLALVVHLIRYAADDSTLEHRHAVDAASVAAAVALVDWFKNETHRVYELFTVSDEEREQTQLVDLIRRKGGTVTARDIRGSFKMDSEAAELALMGLVKTGLGEWENVTSGSKGGPPTRAFRLKIDSSENHNP